MTLAAWTNWNPEPKVHAFGAVIGRRSTVGLCRVTVRRSVGTFDPDAVNACPDCAEFVRAGLSWDDVKDRKIELGPNTIVCRRGVR